MLPVGEMSAERIRGDSYVCQRASAYEFAAALLAAGMVATAPAVVGARPETLPALSNIDVRTTSVVSDVLYNLGSVASAPIAAVEIATELALGLNYVWDDSDFGWGVPINPVFLASAFIENPGRAAQSSRRLAIRRSPRRHPRFPWR